ncbi:MAG: hypothetical protein ACJZ2E_05935 [Thalassobaculaceae bacterium]
MKNLVTIADGRIEYSFYEVKRPAAPTIVMLHEGLGSLITLAGSSKKTI